MWFKLFLILYLYTCIYIYVQILDFNTKSLWGMEIISYIALSVPDGKAVFKFK